MAYRPCPREVFSEVYADVTNSPLWTKTSFHDISDIFQGHNGTLYMDFAHTTERGNEIIASRIFQDVASLVQREIASLNESSDRAVTPATTAEEGRCHSTE